MNRPIAIPTRQELQDRIKALEVQVETLKEQLETRDREVEFIAATWAELRRLLEGGRR